MIIDMAKSRLHLVVIATLLAALLVLPLTESETFTATANLQTLLRNEKLILDTMDDYLKQAEERLGKMKEFIANMQNSDSFDFAQRMAHLDHPIDALNLIKRWADLGTFKDKTGCGLKGATDDLTSRGVTLPTQEDYQGSLLSLLRLQRVYLLRAGDLADGRIRNVTSQSGMTVTDMHDMSIAANGAGERQLAREWLQLAIDRHDGTVPLRRLYLDLAQVYREQGDLAGAIDIGLKALESVGDDVEHTVKNQVARWQTQQKEIQSDAQHTPFDERSWETAETQRTHPSYMPLCRGETYRGSDVLALLFCQYKLGLLPYVRYKEEVFNLDPRLSMFHDVISDEESEQMKELAYPSLYRAQVGDPATAYESEDRISKLTWLWDQLGDPLMSKLSRRIQDMTGLSTKYQDHYSHAEPFQVVNYGIGGQYNPHHDFYDNPTMLEHLPEFIKYTGERIVTFMFYLSGVKAGGSTVFPELDIEVPATKNAAAFWYNVKPSGELDFRTLHAGCPVLLGHKWVGNKWIREWPQMFRRPCGTQISDRDSPKGVRFTVT